MKIKKKLKEARKKIDEQILAENQDLYDELVSKYCISQQESKSESVKKKNKRNWIAVVACVLAVCLVVGLSVILTQPKDKEYLLKNQVTVSATMEEFKSDTKYSVDFGAGYTVSELCRVYDSVSSDTLEYKLKFKHNVNKLSGEIYIVVNQLYNFPINHIGEIVKTEYDNYDMEYSFKKTRTEQETRCEYFGIIKYRDCDIYFSFDELRANGGSSGDTDIVTPSVPTDLFVLK